jgi:hypothetical protein
MAQFININQISAYSSFAGAIDNDSISPNIDQAQTNEIERVLGDALYLKINTAITNSVPLTGDYKRLFDKYVVRLHVYYTCYYYLSFTVPKISQNGAYFITPEKTQILTSDEIEKMAGKYEKLAVSLELKFIAALDVLNLPERPAPSDIKAKSSFNWLKI